MTIKEFYEKHGNYEEALSRLMNDAFINRFLLKFVDGDYLTVTNNAYEGKNFTGIFEATHALKGIAGNLALTELYSISSQICEATRNLKEGESVSLDEQMKKLNEIYLEVVKDIKEIK